MAEGGKQDAGAPIRLSHIYPSRSHDAVNDPLFTFIAVGLPLSVIVYFFRLVAGWSPGSIKGIPIWLTLSESLPQRCTPLSAYSAALPWLMLSPYCESEEHIL